MAGLIPGSDVWAQRRYQFDACAQNTLLTIAITNTRFAIRLARTRHRGSETLKPPHKQPDSDRDQQRGEEVAKPSGPTPAPGGAPLEERAGAVGGLYRDERGRAPGNTRAAEGVRDATSAEDAEQVAERAGVDERASARTNADGSARGPGHQRMQPVRNAGRAPALPPRRRAASSTGWLRWLLLLPVVGFTAWVAVGILSHELNGSWRGEESRYQIDTPQAGPPAPGRTGASHVAGGSVTGNGTGVAAGPEPAWRNPATWTDSFGDGTPDFLRLSDASDREAFRQWFVLIADYQAMRPAPQVPKEIADCASLLRYAYREALKKHDAEWLKGTGMEVRALPEEIEAWHYPDTPLGAGLFRVTPGPFERGDEGTGAFAPFADAKTLVERNAYLVSRNVWQAQPGDLLFYRQFGQSSPWLSMIVTRVGGDAAVVYDTGADQTPQRPIPGNPDQSHRAQEGPVSGESDQSPRAQEPPLKNPDHGPSAGLQRVALTELLGNPQVELRPLASNPNFMGVYRWNILRGSS